MNRTNGQVNMYATVHTTETILIGGAERQASVVECFVDAPERIKWTVKVNETSISGIKNIRSGNLMRLVFNVNLWSQEDRDGEKPER